MVISSINPAQVANTVWTTATRTLTNLSGTAITAIGGILGITSLGTRNFMTIPNVLVVQDLCFTTGAAGTCTIGMNQAGTLFPGSSVSASTAVYFRGSLCNDDIATYVTNNDAVNTVSVGQVGMQYN